LFCPSGPNRHAAICRNVFYGTHQLLVWCGALLSEFLEPKRIALDDLFLDPNNPRFTTEGERRVTEDKVKDAAIQEQAFDKISKEGVEDLRNSILRNGFLQTDRIVVRPLQMGGYLTLEGNRRLAALFMLKQAHEQGDESVSDAFFDSISTVEVLVYTGSEEEAAWIFQGVRHLSGIRDWPAFKKAKVLYEKMLKGGIELLSEVGSYFVVG